MSPADIELSTDNDAFCPLRWGYLQVDMANARTKACCKTPFQSVDPDELEQRGSAAIFNGDYVQQRRLEMLQNQRHQDCAGCWTAEEQGIRSYREEHADRSPFVEVGDDVRRHLDVDRAVPRHVEVIMRTTCDLACSYCGPQFSSRWQREIERSGAYADQGGVPLEIPRRRVDFESTFKQWLSENLSSIDYLQVNGGEPLIQNEFYEWADIFLALPEGAGVQLGVITNLNTPPARLEQLLAILPDLHRRFRFRLGISFDAIGKRAEYIRSGLSWSRMESNLREIIARVPGLDIQLAPTMSALNVSSMPAVIDYVTELAESTGARILFRPSIVMWPDHQSPLVLGGEFRVGLKEALERLEGGRWPELRDRLVEIGEAHLGDDDLRRRRAAFHRWFTEYDQRRGTDFVATFPELEPFWRRSGQEARLEALA